jgi:pimeloyl-ACP methyl ester carboxylesterase
MGEEFEDRFIQVDGVRTRYWQAGAAGTPVLLLAGIGCSVLEWSRNIAALASRHRVYAIDMLGGGLTGKPQDRAYSIPELARFTLAFMPAVGEERAHLIGNSLGGRIALECARLAPERVLSMVLAAPAGVGRQTHINMRLATVPFLGELLTRPSRMGLKMLWRDAFFDRSFVTAELVETKYALASAPGAQKAFLKTLRGFLSPGGFPRDQLEALHAAMRDMKMPALVIWGRQDKFLPPVQADILKAHLPDCEVRLFANCGHAPQVEHAGAFNSTVLAFLDKASHTGNPVK